MEAVVVEIRGDSSCDHHGVELSITLSVLRGESCLGGLVGEEERRLACDCCAAGGDDRHPSCERGLEGAAKD